MSEDLRTRIADLVRRYASEVHSARPFEPGKTRIGYAGRVFDAAEIEALVGAALDFTLTAGRQAAEFELRLAKLFGSSRVLYCSSGSSANLLAVATICSPSRKDPLRAGDEVLTSALAFPTTITPLLRYGLVPVFVDIDAETYNPSLESMGDAMGPRTRAVMLAHTLGNPFDAEGLAEICRLRDMALVEDACDALGSRLNEHLVGTFGDLATLSFYPAHHITTGEGGALIVNDASLAPIAASIRDWGRGCCCSWDEADPSGKCGRRFEHLVSGVAYDHRYIYEEQGYNLKGTDLGAAIGLAQLQKLPSFEAARKSNFVYLRDRLRRHEEHLVLPRSLSGVEPSWFALPITVKAGAPFDRRAIVHHLTEARIETRPLFGGNLLRQPAFRNVPCRVAGSLAGCDRVLESSFFVGIYPGLTEEMREYVADTFDRFFAGKSGPA